MWPFCTRGYKIIESRVTLLSMIKYSIVLHCVVQQLFISSLIIDELEEVSLISSWLLKSVSVPRLHNLHGDKRGPYHMHKQMQDKIYKGSIPCMQQRQINSLKWFDSTNLIYTEATHFFLSSACLPCMLVIFKLLIWECLDSTCSTMWVDWRAQKL